MNFPIFFSLFMNKDLLSTNVATNKPTFLYPDDAESRQGRDRPHEAIDGNNDTFSHTTKYFASIHDKPYWMIDLLCEVLVHNVVIVNRKAYGSLCLEHINLYFNTVSALFVLFLILFSFFIRLNLKKNTKVIF